MVRGKLLAVTVLIAGLLVTAPAAAGLHREQRDRAERVMDQRHAMALAVVRTEIGRYRAVLETLAAGVSTDDELTWDDFDVASSPLQDAELSGAAAVAYVVPVRTADVAASQRLWRERGATDLTMRPQGVAAEHHFPVFVRGLAETGAPLTGTDLSTAPELTGALEDARRIHATAVSDTAPDDPRRSFALAAPVWTRANVPQFRGWVVLSLRGDLLAPVLDTAGQGRLSVSLVAHNSDGSRVAVAGRTVAGAPDLVRDDEFTVGERRWTLVTRADAAHLPGAGGDAARIALGCGAALSVLLAWLVYALATGRPRFPLTLPTAQQPEEPTVTSKDKDDEAVREALERALAERAAIMSAAQLPGMGAPAPAEPEESELRRHAEARGRDRT